MISRRQTLGLAASAAVLGLARPALAQGSRKVRVGYLHTLAVDGQIWTGMARGSFGKQGLDLELRQFNTGLELFQAMVGGSLDVLSTGAVISNFPARGQGKVFLINDVEFATAQLWVREDQGVRTLADLRGRRVARRRAPPPTSSSTRPCGRTASTRRRWSCSTSACRTRSRPSSPARCRP
jgi:NitT/TauT family transport system substrate-binding protein